MRFVECQQNTANRGYARQQSGLCDDEYSLIRTRRTSIVAELYSSAMTGLICPPSFECERPAKKNSLS